MEYSCAMKMISLQRFQWRKHLHEAFAVDLSRSQRLSDQVIFGMFYAWVSLVRLVSHSLLEVRLQSLTRQLIAI